MRLEKDPHAGDDLLETYSMGRLAGLELEEFEEHLLVCPRCQEHLAATDAYVHSIRNAALEFVQQSAQAGLGRPRLFAPNILKPLGMAAMCLFLVTVLQWRLQHRSTAPPALVQLAARRGSVIASNATPAGKPFILALDLTDLQPLSSYRLEIVEAAAGRQVFQSAAPGANNQLRATVAKGLPGGDYYVRLYAPGADLLREYALQVR